MYFLINEFDKSTTGNFLLDVVRFLFALIDTVVYKFFAFLYTLFSYVAQADFYDNSIISNLLQRIWILVGIFALFVLAFNLINMIINPDKAFSSGGKGSASTLIKRIVVAVLLLVSVNAIFKEARSLQNEVIFSKGSNIVSNILGVTNDFSYDGTAVNPGTNLAVNVFFGFFYDAGAENDFGNNPVSECNVTPYPTACLKGDILLSDIFVAEGVKEYNDGWGTIVNVVNKKDEEKHYYYDYDFLISTTAGIFLVYIMINYCFSVGIRVFKLFFLQLIAPFPIIMSVTDKGNESLKKWGKQCFSTYFDVVVKLIIINLVYIIANIIVQTDFAAVFANVPAKLIGWIKIILILSALMFAKKVIDILKDIFPSMGDSGLGLKKMFGSMLGAGVIGGAIGAGGAAIVGGIGAGVGNVINAKQKGMKWYEGLGSVLAGFGSGAVRGVRAGYKNGVKGGLGGIFGAGTGAWTAASRARNARAVGYDIGDKIADKFTDYAALTKSSGTSSEIKDRIKAYDEQIANLRRDENAATDALRTLKSANNAADFAKYDRVFARTLKVDADGKPILGSDGEYQYNYTNLKFEYSNDGNIDWNAMSGNAEGLTAEQLKNYYEIEQSRDRADNEARKLEKAKKKLSEAADQAHQAKK